MEEFSEKLKQVRKELNLTQKDLSKIAGVSDKTIYRWENGESYPSILQKEQIAIQLGLKKDYFYSYNELTLLAEKYMREVVRPKSKINFYKIWMFCLMVLLCLVLLCFAGIYVYYMICLDTLSKHGSSVFVFSFAGLIPYFLIYFFIFIIPIIVHILRKYRKLKRGEN